MAAQPGFVPSPPERHSLLTGVKCVALHPAGEVGLFDLLKFCWSCPLMKTQKWCFYTISVV